jgi:hypothetical protein
MKNSDKPAYVVYDTPNVDPNNMGMTKRELFAAMALQGMLANGTLKLSLDRTCELSIFYADELLKQLES